MAGLTAWTGFTGHVGLSLSQAHPAKIDLILLACLLPCNNTATAQCVIIIMVCVSAI